MREEEPKALLPVEFVGHQHEVFSDRFDDGAIDEGQHASGTESDHFHLVRGLALDWSCCSRDSEVSDRANRVYISRGRF